MSRGCVGRRNTKVVNNARDLCNRRLVHVQPVPRNSTLQNRSTSKHHRCTCAPTAISGPSCIVRVHVTCIRARHYVHRLLNTYLVIISLPSTPFHWWRFLRLIEYNRHSRKTDGYTQLAIFHPPFSTHCVLLYAVAS